MQTVAHVTHEAIQKIGGIGAVLQGLLTSKVYLQAVPRNILIGPFWPGEERGERRLGPNAEVLYSSLDSLYRSPLAAKFREIEQKYDVGIIYGRRKFADAQSGVSSMPEILLFDVSHFDEHQLGIFKFDLWKKYGIDSGKYQDVWDYEQYLRIARPAIDALHALGATSPSEPCIILSHEYMGVPTGLAAIMDGARGNFRTVFHAHECATMRRIVEGHGGHDTMFYNVMSAAMSRGHFVEEVFGDQSGYYKHALVKCVRFFDNINAVGDYTLKEMRFLGPDFLHVDAQVAYNGVPSWQIDLSEKMRSRNILRKYCSTLLKYEPDYVFTHVTRLVPSKGLWRDLRVMEAVDADLRKSGESAVLFVLSTEVPARRSDDIRRMESAYRWPVVHREGHCDLSGGEAAYYQGVQEFNAQARNVKVVFINQFGFDQKTCGLRIPEGTEFMDIRKGSDAEFGQSIYEPFGIAQVEPISFGGICVYTNVCGCAGFVKHAAEGCGSADGSTPNAIVADYTRLPERGLRPEELLAISTPQRDAIEHEEAARVARELLSRLPRTPGEQEAFIERGHELASRMSWDAVAREYILPGFEKAKGKQRLREVV
jgi:hypothetical protein